MRYILRVTIYGDKFHIRNSSMSKKGFTAPLPQLTDGQIEALIQNAGAGTCVMGDITTPLHTLLRREDEAQEDEEGTLGLLKKP